MKARLQSIEKYTQIRPVQTARGGGGIIRQGPDRLNLEAYCDRELALAIINLLRAHGASLPDSYTQIELEELNLRLSVHNDPL